MNIYSAAQRFERFKVSLMRKSVIYISDNEEILIENCTEVEEFNENCIKAVMKKCVITITGLDLKMRSCNNSSVSIKGKIHSVSFIEKE